VGVQETAPVAASPHTIWWEVVAFSAASEIKVQRGTTSMAAGVTSATVSLPISVDREHAFSLVSFTGSGTGPDFGAQALQAQLTNSTTLTIQRSDPGDADPVEDITWQVIDLKDGSRVRSGSASFAAGTATATATLDPVDTTRATAFASVDYGGGEAMGRTTYVADDIPGTATATVTLTSATQVDLARANTGGTTTITWYVVEWGGPRTWDTSYAYRRPLYLDTTTAAPTGYTMSVTVDHAALVAAGKARSDGADLRVVYFDGSSWTELDRVLDSGSAWNTSTTTLRFRTRTALAANSRTTAYFLHYGNPSASAPPANGANVWLFTEGFEGGNLNNWTIQTRNSVAWYNQSWRYRKQITLVGSKITGSLTSFPVLVSVTDGTGLKVHARGDGADILFTNADGRTRLDHETESYDNTTGALVAWVRMPSLTVNTSATLYLYYGNASATGLQNAVGVWDTNYQGVWHLNQTPTGSADDIADSSSAANHGSSQGGMAAPVAGKMGKALTFDGSNDYVSTANTILNPQVLTAEAWFYTGSATGKKILGFEDKKTGTPASNYDRLAYLGTDSKVWIALYDQTGAQNHYVTSAAVSLNAWHQVVFTYNTTNDNFLLYVDGTLTSGTSPNAKVYDGWWRIGSWKVNPWTNGADGYFTGQIDEVRVSNIARSGTWIQTEYNNLSSPSTFHTLSSTEEDVTAIFSAASDQHRTGTYSLKIAPHTSLGEWIVANGIDEPDLMLEAWWRLSAVSGVDAAMGLRAGPVGPVNEYEAMFTTAQHWRNNAVVNDAATSLAETGSAATCPAVSTWTKVTLVVTGTSTKVLCNDVAQIPASGWTSTSSVSPPLTSGSLGFRAYTIPAANNIWIDDIVARRYVDLEPVVSLGLEDRV
jgi:hypothetical protein